MAIMKNTTIRRKVKAQWLRGTQKHNDQEEPKAWQLWGTLKP